MKIIEAIGLCVMIWTVLVAINLMHDLPWWIWPVFGLGCGLLVPSWTKRRP